MAKPIAKLVSLLTPKRRWAQFSLATMFVVVTALCIWLAVVVNRAHRQRDTVAAIETLGGSVGYVEPNQEEPNQEPFLRRWLPQDYFDEVQDVDLSVNEVTDGELAYLQGLTALRVLLLDGAQVTDAGLAHLHGLTELQELFLDDTQVTDVGLAHLHWLKRLKVLSLNGTHITDAGLIHLHSLTGLELLWLDATQVTDAGAAQLRQALPNCQIIGR